LALLFTVVSTTFVAHIGRFGFGTQGDAPIDIGIFKPITGIMYSNKTVPPRLRYPANNN